MSDTSETNSVDSECDSDLPNGDLPRNVIMVDGERWPRPEGDLIVANSEIERLQAVVADQALTIGTLKDSNAAQACVIRDYGLENSKLQAQVNKIGALKDTIAKKEREIELMCEGFGRAHGENVHLQKLLDARGAELKEQEREMEALHEQDRVNGATIAEFMKAVANLQNSYQTSGSLTAAAAQHTTALERRVAWYERREPLIRAALGQDAPAVAEYELLNPKPGAET